MYRAYFYKLIRSPYLYIGIVGVFGICSLRLLPSAFKGIDVIAEMEILRTLDGFQKMFVILGALPFAANFSDEWNCMVTTSCVTRKSIRKYSAANVVMCYASSLVTVFVGMMIFVGVYSMIYPFYLPGKESMLPPYDVLPPLLGIMAVTFVFSASCAMWAVMGLMLSAFFPSKYIAICSPFVFSYAIERISMNFSDDNLWSISLSHTALSALPAFIFANFVFLGISAVCGIIFTFTAERKVQNGLG